MMSTAIAFLSGKGGSGKTTLALSMADLLCKCGIRILLIDCDMSTNGATYFYETQLVDRSQSGQPKPLSFNDLLNADDYLNNPILFEIDPNLAFIPSISEISDQHLMEETVRYRHNLAIRLENFISWAQLSYDVILFDCQAGYTELLPLLLPLMDVDLFVLEADSISASAMRSLHLKIGRFLGHARLYQIFNKATQEEFDIYSKIVGTFFTNIGTLLFDWKIRQAFSRAQIPDLENTSAKFGSDLCDICKIILSDKAIQRKLSLFSVRLTSQRLEEQRKLLEDKLYEFAVKPYSRRKFSLITGLISIFTVMITGFLLFLFKDIGISSISTVILPVVATIITICCFISTNTYSFQEKRKIRQKYERELKDIDRELEKLNLQRWGDTID